MKQLLIGLLVFMSFNSAWGADGDSDKLDLKKLEDKYWSAKDDDFSVVQNRAFTKGKRWFVNLNYGIPISDPYDTGNADSITVGYYFSEQLGLEITQMSTAYSNNTATSDFITNHQTTPDHNTLKGQTYLQVDYVPFYAKMSFLDKRIVYFDMGIGLIVGSTSYQEHQNIGDVNKSGATYGLSLFQQFFLSPRWAVKVDYRNTWTNEERLHYVLTPPNTDRSLGSKSINDSQLLLGVTYFFSFTSQK